MNNLTLIAVLVIVGGIAITLQGHFMGLMDKGLGTRESVFITYASGGIIASLVILFSKDLNLQDWVNLPWYVFTSGVLGLIIVGTIGYVVPTIGLAAGFTALIGAQFMSAVIVDHWGLFQAERAPMEFSRLLGIGVMLVGVWLVLR